jgi:GntR family transcriptional repressor for pyruvate dehydrogenase complex
MSEPKKLYRRIADSIAADIQSGRYKPGDRLPPERDLAVQYGVSRPTLREAMIALEILGMIEAKHGLGIIVTKTKPDPLPFSDSEIGAFELIEARRLLEGEVCALAATLITDEQVTELEGLVNQMHHADLERAERADREFHVLIAKISGNGAIASCVENLWDWRYRSPLARNILARAANLGMGARIDEHGDILAALKSRSGNAARQAMHDHLDRVIEHLLNATEIVAVERVRQANSERRQAIARRLKGVTD